MAQKNYDAALRDLNEAIRQDPNSPAAYFFRGWCYASLKDYDRALRDYDKVIELNPNYAQVFYNRGNLYLGKGDHDRAITDYDEAIRLNPKFAEAYNNRASAYGAKGDQDRVLIDLEEMIRLNPNNTTGYKNRGRAYRNKGDFDRAMRDYDESLRLEPNAPDVYAERGFIRFYRGQFQAAEQEFSKAAQANAAEAYSAVWLYLARARGGRSGKADLERAAAKLKLDTPGRNYVELFLETTVPINIFLAAKSLDAKTERSNMCAARFYVGQFALLKNQKAEAAKLFKAALEICPTDVAEYMGAKVELARLGKINTSPHPPSAEPPLKPDRNYTPT
jgi:tetratricopeptide (TPR) repeat protein